MVIKGGQVVEGGVEESLAEAGVPASPLHQVIPDKSLFKGTMSRDFRPLLFGFAITCAKIVRPRCTVTKNYADMRSA